MCTPKNIQRVYFFIQPSIALDANGNGTQLISGQSLNFPLSYRNALVKEINISGMQFTAGQVATIEIKAQLIPLNGIGGVNGRRLVGIGSVSGGLFFPRDIQTLGVSDVCPFISHEGIECTGLEVFQLCLQARNGTPSINVGTRCIIEIVLELP